MHWFVVGLDLLHLLFGHDLLLFVQLFLKIKVFGDVFLDFAVELGFNYLGLGVVDLELSNLLLQPLNLLLQLSVLKWLLLELLIMLCLNLTDHLLIPFNLDLHLLLLSLYLVKLFVMSFDLALKVCDLHLKHFLFFLDELHLHDLFLGLTPCSRNFILKCHHLLIQLLLFLINHFKFLLELVPLSF